MDHGRDNAPSADRRSLTDLPFDSDEVIQCPYPFYAALRDEAPVFRDAKRGDYFVSRRKDIMFILQHPEIFSNQVYRVDPRILDDPRTLMGLADPELPSCPLDNPANMTVSDGQDHALKRRGASGLVSRERLAAAEPLMREIANELLDSFENDGHADFRAQFAHPMALLTICQLAGFPKSDRDIFMSWVLSTTHGRRFMNDAAVEDLRQAAIDQMDYVLALIRERYDHPRDDFLSEFVAASVARDGGLNLPYLVSELRIILTAGNETTQRLLTNTMLLLIRNPEAMARVRADPAAIPSAIEESLRIESPTQWVSRVCLEDTEVGGISIPAGSLVINLYASANRDEGWHEADTFDIDRVGVRKHHLAFGGGPHRCIGAPIARLEARVALETSLARLENIQLAPAHADDLRNIDNLQKRVPVSLPIKFDRR